MNECAVMYTSRKMVMLAVRVMSVLAGKLAAIQAGPLRMFRREQAEGIRLHSER